jgi:hypothetical protein
LLRWRLGTRISSTWKPLDGERGELELISKEDYFTGSRYVRGLKDIEVVLVQ